MPVNLKSIGCDFVSGFGKNVEEKHIYFTSEVCPELNDYLYKNRVFWNQTRTLFIHYPKGADYSSVEGALIDWQHEDSNNFEYVMVETNYKLIYN